MKPYFFLLAIMYVATVLNLGFALAFSPSLDGALKAVADLALFGLCLRASHALAFGKTLYTPQTWRLVYRATLGLGLLTVFLLNRAAPESGVLRLALSFVNYLVFAIPAVLYERELKMKDEAGASAQA